MGRAAAYVGAGEKKEFSFDLAPGFLLGWDLITSHGFMFQVQAGVATAASVTLADGKYAPENGVLGPGRVTVTVESRTAARGAMLMIELPPDHFTAHSSAPPLLPP